MKTCSKCKKSKDFKEFRKHKTYSDGYYCWCILCEKEYKVIYYLKNRNRLLKKQKRYAQNNTESIRNYHRKYRNKKRKQDVNYRMAAYLRTWIYNSVKKGKNSRYRAGSAVRDLGCPVPELKKYLEDKFQPGMNWDNYGRNGWHIDHIKPLSSFNLSSRGEFLQACHYSNLQPLWEAENIRKSNKIE